jgi:large subunit ribosomal protein L10
VDRVEKKQLVEHLQQSLKGAEAVIVARYSGLTVAELSDLRRQMRQAGAGFKVIKNRITRLALADTPYRGLADLFKGPTAIAYSSDPVAAAKVAAGYAKKNEKLVLVGGALGETALDIAAVKALASLPSLDELRATLVGLLQAPARQVAVVCQAPAAQIARVIGAFAAKAEAG